MEARAPFDAIVVSAAFTSVPAPLAAQLVHGGRLVQQSAPVDGTMWSCSSTRVRSSCTDGA